jgi:predicted transcriptional regulator
MNSDDFLDYYNKIDSFLKKIEGYETYVSFSQKVKNTSNKVVKLNKDELLSFGELRNAIVHNPKFGNQAIAEPHDEIVFKIKELHEKITNPKKVIPEFQFEVLGARENDFVNDILIKMRNKSFSQFPVFNLENNVIELINTNTISRWLSIKLEENGTIMTENIKVADLINEIEFQKNYKFISRNTSVYEAYDLFINQINTKNRNLDVLFITNSGKETEKLLGLITIEDIATKI